MLSFLQQKLRKSPTKPTRTMTRQDTIRSAFSRVDARNASKAASATPSLTTATSLTDASSEPTDVSENSESHVRSSARPRSIVDSYNEKALAGHIPQTTPSGVDEEDHIIPSETLLEGAENSSREKLLQQSVQALDEGWNFGAMPGDNLQVPTKDHIGGVRRKSTRLDIFDQASAAIEKTTSTLGKRTRGAMEIGKEKLNALKGSRRIPGAKQTDVGADSTEHPRKRARFSSVHDQKATSPEPQSRIGSSSKRSKRWVTQGLYVGQSPDFNPKLTETKNKAKRGSTKGRNTKESSILPLPMFAGERLLTLGRDFNLPYDIFSPLPPGQPKPDEWKKTHKSSCTTSRPQFSVLTLNI